MASIVQASRHSPWRRACRPVALLLVGVALGAPARADANVRDSDVLAAVSSTIDAGGEATNVHSGDGDAADVDTAISDAANVEVPTGIHPLDMLAAGHAAAAPDPFAGAGTAASSTGGALGQPALALAAQVVLRSVADDLKLCVRGLHTLCQEKMKSRIADLKGAQQTAETWALHRVRNNMFFYLMAPSLRWAIAIVKSTDHGAWAGMNICSLAADAKKEVGERRALPEYRELEQLNALLLEKNVSCRSAVGDD